LLIAEKEATRAQYALAARRRRLPMVAFGWTLPFYSSRGTSFSDDCGAGGGFLVNAFIPDGDQVYRTYATTSRGVDRGYSSTTSRTSRFTEAPARHPMNG
jgi:predicted dithiol-disulfide oxidoreductase (DUF899 family)